MSKPIYQGLVTEVVESVFNSKDWDGEGRRLGFGRKGFILDLDDAMFSTGSADWHRPAQQHVRKPAAPH